MPAQSHIFVVSQVVWETPTVFCLRLKPKEDKLFPFLSGQFMMISLPHQQGLIKRAYSISSSPTVDHLEFTIRAQGPFTTRLSELSTGTELLLDGPYGAFTLDSIKEKLVFLAGGVGVAPFVAMIEYMVDKKVVIPVTLIYGNRTAQEIAHFKRLSINDQSHDWLRVIFTVDQPSQEWKGEVGFITVNMLKKYIPHWHDSTFFVCGPPAFVSAMLSLLQNESVNRGDVRIERFVGAGS